MSAAIGKKPFIYILMPFGGQRGYEGGQAESKHVFQTIEDAADEVFGKGRYTLRRELEMTNTGSIASSIVENIATADYVIADITGANPNVCFELGIRHSLKQNGTILICQDTSRPLPFDVSHHRFFFYSQKLFEQESMSLFSGLCKYLKKLKDEIGTERDGLDSPVYEAFRTRNILRRPDPLNPVRQDTFQDITEARTKIREVSRAALEHGESVHIKYIGMTMFNAWEQLKWVFEKLKQDCELEDLANQEVKFEVAMMCPEWLEREKIRDTWTGDQAIRFKNEIKDYFDEAPERWCGTVALYEHMPCIHGALVNENHLFWGVSRWEQKGMHAGDKHFDYITGSTRLGKDTIAVFQSWFDRCFSGQDQKYFPLHLASAS